MTAATTPVSGAPRAFTPMLFVAAVFASASLVFMVEPMIAKLVLPLLGGSSAVWNTSLAFFQGALLLGYVYAHLLQRLPSMRLQIVLHLAVLIVAALVLPLKVSALLGEPPPDQPALWLLGVLALSVGPPFAALSATAPLVQAWHARVFKAQDAKEPYGLYAASNLGSLLALLAYPVLVEPLITLQGQTLGWSIGYGVFFVVLGTLGLALWRRSSGPAADANETPASSAAITWTDRAIWVGLAAIPSSLMLGVTSFVATDIGSAPFLWVAPLALYLGTFIIAFQDKPLIKPEVTLVLQAAAVVVCLAFMHMGSGNFILKVGLHLACFFFTALMCHQALVARRPAPAHLTDFYICMSLGGVVGGSFNAFLAPVMFNTVVEYPAALVLAALARPWNWRDAPKVWVVGAMALALAGAIAAVTVVHPPPQIRHDVFQALGKINPVNVAAAFLGITVLAAFLLRGRVWTFLPALLILTLAADRAEDRVDVVGNWRSFFGVLRESRASVPGLGGEIRMLAHGTTLHGAQAQSPRYRCQPLVYYGHETPIGQVFDGEAAIKANLNVGAVGLGTGSVAAYNRRGDSLNFFEIDPLVFHVSSNRRVFSYTTQCAQGRVGYILGDARLTLNHEPAGRYDILLIDAFSSDSVPAHLLTVEAVKMYLTKIKPDGIIILHLSNRNLDLIRPAEAVALAAGGWPLVQDHQALPGLPDLWEASEDAVIVAKTPAGLAPFRANDAWRPVDPQGVRPWTDDYTNIFGALVRRTREKWTGKR